MLTNLTNQFPNLLPSGGFLRTSPPTPTYNCLAWAAGVDGEWWEPDTFGLFKWPPGIAREYTLKAYIAAYKAVGFLVCPTPTPEEGHEKIALYVKQGRPTHAARLLSGGKWTSKLGPSDDISHELDGLNGAEYGAHSVYMKRAVTK